MSPFVEFDFCDHSCDKRFSNLLATGSIGSCAQNLAEAMVGSKNAAVQKLKEMSTKQKERTCLKKTLKLLKGENLLEAENGDDGAGDHDPDGCHEHRVQHLVIEI